MKPAIEIEPGNARLTPDQVQEALIQYYLRSGLEVVGEVVLSLDGASAKAIPHKRQRKSKAAK